MHQSTLDLDTLPADHADRTGFDIGWDHAHHGLVPMAELLLAGTPVRQGWLAGKAVFGRRTLTASRHVRLWLQLRIDAWRQGLAFETLQVTPHYLAQIDTTVCPVTRQPLGGVAGSPTAPVVERLQAEAGYAAGHLAVFSQAASSARAGCSAAEALAKVQRLEIGDIDRLDGLGLAEWRRLAVLLSFVTPTHHADASRLPLAALPPNRVRVLNAVQGLQTLVTSTLAKAGWSTRLRALADLLPADLRQDFFLFIGALAPRVMEWPQFPLPMLQRQLMEDLWADARVQRRWHPLALALGAERAERLVARAAEAGLGGQRALVHERDAATEGWGLDNRGLVRRPGATRRSTRPALPRGTPAVAGAASAGLR